MNLRRDSGVALVRALVVGVGSSPKVDVAICPPNVYLGDIAAVVQGSPIGLGGQNVSNEKDGAFTGEVSTGMLTDLGCLYVILGHSERRQMFGESSVSVNKKLYAALAAGLTPIVCVGETREERESGKTESIVGTQVNESLQGLTDEQLVKTVVAYEPVWAIGTGLVATPKQAEDVHAHIRRQLREMHGSAADRVVIQYGGSVKPDNAAELMHQPNIDGALVGGASLKADDFLKIIIAAG